MDLGPAIESFIVEAEDLLTVLDENLAILKSTPSDTEAINCVFRAVHTIKGSAGLFGFDNTVNFTHAVETVLMGIRDSHQEIDQDTLATLIQCSDHIAKMIEGISTEGENHGTSLINSGKILLKKIQPDNEPTGDINPQPDQGSSNIQKSTETPHKGSRYWHISLRFQANVFRNGMDPIAFIRYLKQLGSIFYIETIADTFPNWDSYSPESCYLGFEIALEANTTKNDIEDVFDFVKDDVILRVLPPRTNIKEFISLIDSLAEPKHRMIDILIHCKAINPSDHKQKLELLTPKSEPKDRQVLRVDTRRLDHLIGLIGELVISGANVNLLAEESKNSALIESIEVMSHLIEEVRGSCLSLRMVQIGQSFSKLQRTVRNLSQELDKDIDLNITGYDTELDKSMVEKISDPLLQLIRNAIDHGIESREQRLAQGKPEHGVIKLSASYDSGYIVIEIKDDGQGLNKEKIIEKAIGLGLIESSNGMSDSDIYQLILCAGLSTSDNVSNVSGRGVGMDIVRRNIEEIRGSIDIDSAQNQGTCITIRLPLTLAIIDGFLIGIDKSRYIIPLDSVVECVELSGNDYHLEKNNNYIELRGEILPTLRLRELFSLPEPLTSRENIVIVESGNDRAGIIVDDLYGEFQTVVKPMSNIFGQLKWINGSTILGDGSVAIIIEVSGMIRTAKKNMNITA